MKITPSEITEVIFDELAVGLADRAPQIHIERIGPGKLDLDYGTSGHFTLTIEETPISN